MYVRGLDSHTLSIYLEYNSPIECLFTSRHITYFNDLACLGRDFLHPGGQWSSEKLISHLPKVTSSHTVVELGCGLGATAELLLARHPCTYIGIDASPEMLERAQVRLQQHAQASFIRYDLGDRTIPLADSSADVIIAESVLGLLDPLFLIGECYRVLKPEGLLLLNERIWGHEISIEEIMSVNLASRRLYGFLVSAEDLTTSLKWKEVLERSGFAVEEMEGLDKGKHMSEPTRQTKFIKALLHPHLLPTLWRDRRFAKRYTRLWPKMEHWLFIARKVG